MLHIIILNKGYFPEKLKASANGKDKVVVIAAPNDSIPVSAYQNEMFQNIEVKLIPEMKDISTKEGKERLRIAQALLIGKLTSDNEECEVYTDDIALMKAILPFIGNKKVSARKTVSKKNSPARKETKNLPEKEEQKVEVKEEAKEEIKPVRKAAKTKKTTTKKATTKEIAPKEEKKAEVVKMPKKEKAAKLPTLAQVKSALGAANSSYAKIVMATLKKSNQITFEMNMRMKLAETGLENTRCQELAKSLNDEFAKALPLS